MKCPKCKSTVDKEYDEGVFDDSYSVFYWCKICKTEYEFDDLIYVCNGCQREELHKYCPAHGTEFYMSGYEFTHYVEEIIKKARSLGYEDIDVALINVLKSFS